MSFFMSADYSLSTKVMEIIYFIIGLLCIYCGVKNLKDKENPEPVGTFIFWAVLGVVLALGRWLPSLVSGILVVVMPLAALSGERHPGGGDVHPRHPQEGQEGRCLCCHQGRDRGYL